MKKLLTILLCLICANSFATNFYFATSGNDANSGTIGSPWATISKFNSVFASKAPGDSLLFRRGDTFYGTLTISRNGGLGLPIVLGAYGTGANPVITGLTNVTAWTNLGGNIWESTAAVSTLATCNMIVINAVNTPMGKFPQSGYFNYQSTSSTSLTSTSIPSSTTNWTGAMVVKRSNNWILDKGTISSHSGNVINYSPGSGYAGIAGYGFFIQNDVRTLTYQNAWFYNTSTKKIRIFSTSSPTGVQVATLDNLVSVNGHTHITYSNISFIGSNTLAINITSSPTQSILSCTIDFSGIDALKTTGSSSDSLKVIGCTIDHTNNSAIFCGAGGTNATITGNTINNTALYPGMIASGDANGFAIRIGNGLVGGMEVSNNIINGCGYIAIYGQNSNNQLIHNNFIKHWCLVKTDGAAIYFYSNLVGSRPSYGGVRPTGSKIYNNIIDSSTNDGQGAAGSNLTLGIYMDGQVVNTEIYGNTVANAANTGILINSGDSAHNVHDNTCFANNYQLQVTSTIGTAGGSTPRTEAVGIKNNKFISRTASQKVASWETVVNNAGEISQFSTTSAVDSNYLARPIDDNIIIQTVINGFVNITQRNLAQWVAYSGFDVHSKKSPVTITNVNQFFFGYNTATHDSTIIIPAGTWVDITGAIYNTSVVLHTMTSIVLMNTGSNIAPTANAGPDKNITLPTSSVTQTGSGTDPDGSISAYAWSQISGPSTVTFGSATSATSTINSMTVAGTYVIQLKVTDNGGLTGVDNMNIIVNPTIPPNLPPVVDAGGNKVITLPTSTVTQTGSATDPDGTVSSYGWTQDPANPIPATIVSPTSATTVINGLFVGGPYNFTLSATDNLGAIGSKTITVQVNAPAPVPPVAHAGTDQTITWPTNSVTLSGSGTDADGVVVAYSWTRLSGSGTITDAASASTTVTGIIIGVSQFQLKVTDNSGATGLDTIQITLNQGSETISASGTTVIYTGSPLAPIITTSPAGISYTILIDGVSSTVIDAGNHPYTAGNNDPNWVASPISGIFTINKATAVISAPNVTANYDALPHPGVATTTPAGLTGITHSYSSGSVPTAIGVYHDTIRISHINYQATQVIITITIISNPAVIFISDTLFTYDATPHNVTVTSLYTYSLTGSPRTNAGTNQVIATITQVGHVGADTANITVLKAAGVITWPPPGSIPAGSKITPLTLSATANVPGVITYDHPLGEVVNNTIVVTAVFVPTDTANYTGATLSRTINVIPANNFIKFLIIGPNGQILFIKQ